MLTLVMVILLAIISIARVGTLLTYKRTAPLLRVLSEGPCGNGQPVERLDLANKPHAVYLSRLNESSAGRGRMTHDVVHVVLLTHLVQSDRTLNVMQTWARPRCIRVAGHALFVRMTPFFFHAAEQLETFDWSGTANAYNFYLSHEDVLPLPAGTAGTSRTAAAIPAALSRYPDLTWVFKADDDSFVHVGRLARTILTRDPNIPQLIGSLVRWNFPPFAVGGAGYALSAAAVSALGPVMETCVDAHHHSNRSYRGTNFEDAMMSSCVQAHWGYNATSDEPGLNLHTPEDTPHYSSTKVAAPAISHHYMTPERVFEIMNPSVPRRVIQLWPWSADVSDDITAGALLASQLCADHCAASGFEYVLERWSPETLRCASSSWAASLPPRIRELIGRLELLYFRGGLAISLWAACDAVDLDAAHASVQNLADEANYAASVLDLSRKSAAHGRGSGTLPELVLDDLFGQGFGSASGHGVACSEDAARRGCDVAVATRFSLQAWRFYSMLSEHAKVRVNMRQNYYMVSADNEIDPHFEMWLLRLDTLRGIAADVNIHLLPLLGRTETFVSESASHPLRVLALGDNRQSTARKLLLFFLSDAFRRRVELQSSHFEAILLIDLDDEAHSNFLNFARRKYNTYFIIAFGKKIASCSLLVSAVHVIFGFVPINCSIPTLEAIPNWLPSAINLEELNRGSLQFVPTLSAKRFTYDAAAAWKSRGSNAMIPTATMNDSGYAFARATFNRLRLNITTPGNVPSVDSVVSQRFIFSGSSCSIGVAALIGGAVPIFSTNPLLDTIVFNPLRYLVIGSPPNAAETTSAPIVALQTGDSIYQTWWFREPTLEDTSTAWLRVWSGVQKELLGAFLTTDRL